MDCFPHVHYLPGDWEKRVLKQGLGVEQGSLVMGWMVRKEVAFQCPSLKALFLGKLTGQQFLFTASDSGPRHLNLHGHQFQEFHFSLQGL